MIILNEMETFDFYPRHLKTIVSSCIMANDTNRTVKYLYELMRTTEYDTNFIVNNKQFVKISRWHFWRQFIKEYKNLKLQYYNNIDFDYSIQLQKMLYL